MTKNVVIYKNHQFLESSTYLPVLGGESVRYRGYRVGHAHKLKLLSGRSKGAVTTRYFAHADCRTLSLEVAWKTSPCCSRGQNRFIASFGNRLVRHSYVVKATERGQQFSHTNNSVILNIHIHTNRLYSYQQFTVIHSHSNSSQSYHQLTVIHSVDSHAKS